MATYTWTGSGNWGNTLNWTPNGTPTNVDTVLFSSANNSNCTIAANANAQILNFQNYQGTVTINTNIALTVAGNLTLSTSSSFQITTDVSGLGALVISANSVITSNGRTIGAILRFSTINTTIQLADAMILSRGLTALGTPAGFINLISSSPGTQRSLTLVNNGTSTQYVDYLNVTDLDGSQGATIWTYKGTVSNSSNWFVMSTQPPGISRISIS